MGDVAEFYRLYNAVQAGEVRRRDRLYQVVNGKVVDKL